MGDRDPHNPFDDDRPRPDRIKKPFRGRNSARDVRVVASNTTPGHYKPASATELAKPPADEDLNRAALILHALTGSKPTAKAVEATKERIRTMAVLAYSATDADSVNGIALDSLLKADLAQGFLPAALTPRGRAVWLAIRGLTAVRAR